MLQEMIQFNLIGLKIIIYLLKILLLYQSMLAMDSDKQNT